jgi:hypothetical protein
MKRRSGRWLFALGAVSLAAAGAFELAGCGSSSGDNGTTGGSSSGSSGSGDDGSGDDGTGGDDTASTGGSSGSSGGANSGGSSGSGSKDAGAGSSSDGGFARPPPGEAGTSTCLKMGSGDYSMPGPYTVETQAGVDLSSTGDLPTGDAGPTTATIFYPSDLSEDCPHPIVSWANGTGVTGSMVYGFFNENAASWGIVVIAADNPNSAGDIYYGPGAGPYNRAGIDYLLKANEDASSPFYHHLGTRAGVSGHSQGAIAATLATQHPNVTAEVQVEGSQAPKAGIAFLALTGSNDTVVGTQAPMMSYNAATGPSMFAEYTGADHMTTPTEAGWFEKNAGTIQFVRFYTAWWRCFLGDDQIACAMFKGGSSCGVCKDPNWTSLVTKNM